MVYPAGARPNGLFHPLWISSALLFLFLRNVPFSLRTPIGTFGDELGRVDCVMKLCRGHLPHPADFVERRLIRFYYQTTPGRALPHRLPDPTWIASYSFQAIHPPLVPLLLVPWMKLFQWFGLNLGWQIRLLRVVCLLPVAMGMWLVWYYARRIGSLVWLIPPLLVPLFTNDMFFSVNSDTFSFLFGSWALVGMARLIRNPDNHRIWWELAVAFSLALGTKASNAVLLIPWVVMVWMQFRARLQWQILVRGMRWLCVGLALAGGWYVLNWMNYGHPFIYSYPNPNLRGLPTLPPVTFSFGEIARFFSAYPLTLIRGELYWKEGYFDVLTVGWNRLLLAGIPILLYMLGARTLLRDRSTPGRAAEYFEIALWVFVPIGFCLLLADALIILPVFLLALGFMAMLRSHSAQQQAEDRLLLISGLFIPMAMLAGYFLINAPFYQGRYSMVMLPSLVGIAVAGWRSLPRPLFSPWLPVFGLLAHNLAYALLLFDRL